MAAAPSTSQTAYCHAHPGACGFPYAWRDAGAPMEFVVCLLLIACVLAAWAAVTRAKTPV